MCGTHFRRSEGSGIATIECNIDIAWGESSSKNKLTMKSCAGDRSAPFAVQGILHMCVIICITFYLSISKHMLMS
jgi:hypothetical protein